MKKKISCKSFFAAVWNGIWRTLRSVWRLFRYDNEMGLGKYVCRLLAGSLSVCLGIFICLVLWFIASERIYKEMIRPRVSQRIWDEIPLSNRIVLQRMYYSKEKRLYDNVSRKVLMHDLDWVVSSPDRDSLAVFAKKGKRGYLNRFTGEVAIPLSFKKAWVFSEGLAAVEKDRKLVFIDHSGKVVIDNNLEVNPRHLGYAFKSGYCMAKDAESGYVGLIDKNGNWALEPKYDDIGNCNGNWYVEKGGYLGLLNARLDTIFPPEYLSIDVSDGIMEVQQSDFVVKRYDLEGNLLVDFAISGVCNLEYETGELDGTASRVSDDYDEYYVNNKVYATANCMQYSVSDGWRNKRYGLLSRSGKRLTPPLYTDITAIGPDLYLCQPYGVILNDNGEVVQ